MVVNTPYRKNGKKYSYTYERIHVSEFTESTISWYFRNAEKHSKNSKKSSYKTDLQSRINRYQYKFGKYSESAIDVCCGFDIETTKIDDNKTFMYGWQFGIENTVIWGETWQQFIEFLAELKRLLQANDKQRLIVFVANLGYEWQFMKHFLTVTDSFFKETREPVEITHDGFITFKECLSWGGSLAKLATDYCSIPKLKGDLDYSVYRESYRDFKNCREWAYIDFDVLILTQFARWFNDTYLRDLHSKPVTITQALNHRIKARQTETGEEKPTVKDFPKNYTSYDTLMSWVYRGGYVHANERYVGRVLSNLWSFDFTSSYPARMLQELFPWRFTEVDPAKLNLVNYNFDGSKFAFYGLFIFTNIRATTDHSIESKSKCVKLPYKTVIKNGKEKKVLDAVIDNGRIKSVNGDMWVWLTNLDYDSYREFYDWDTVKCAKLMVSRLKPLPNYLVDELSTLYTTKAILKKEHKNYALEKAYCNSTYGLTVKRIIVKDCVLLDGSEVVHVDKDTEKEYKRYTEKSLLLPQWGCWISAYARRELLKVVFQLETNTHDKQGNIVENHVIYCDTDSIKFTSPYGREIVKKYNNDRQARMAKICNDRQLEKSIFWDLGSFDNEYPHGIKKLKTLGAKRYIHTYIEGGSKHYQATVAGLPKKEYIRRYAKSDELFFDSFEDELVVEKCKIASVYNDSEPFEVRRMGKREIVPSCITLVDSSFSLTMDGDWLQILIGYNTGVREKRNL